MTQVAKHINLFLSSKNRQPSEHVCDFNVNLNNNIITAGSNQKIRLSVLNFHIPNNYYNINETNNEFHVIIRNAVDDYLLDTKIYKIEPGNYNVLTFRDYINQLCKDYLHLTYNKARNTYAVKSLLSNSVTVALKIVSCGQFFGLDNAANFEYELSTEDGDETDYTINMCAFDKIVLRVNGLNIRDSTVDNIGGKIIDKNIQFTRSNILLWASRNDIPINGMIRFENLDSNANFSYVLNDRDINEFNLTLTDEYGNALKTALDYTLLLKFEIFEDKTREMLSLIDLIVGYLHRLSYYVGEMYIILVSKFGITGQK